MAPVRRRQRVARRSIRYAGPPPRRPAARFRDSGFAAPVASGLLRVSQQPLQVAPSASRPAAPVTGERLLQRLGIERQAAGRTSRSPGQRCQAQRDRPATRPAGGRPAPARRRAGCGANATRWRKRAAGWNHARYPSPAGCAIQRRDRRHASDAHDAHGRARPGPSIDRRRLQFIGRAAAAPSIHPWPPRFPLPGSFERRRVSGIARTRNAIDPLVTLDGAGAIGR